MCTDWTVNELDVTLSKSQLNARILFKRIEQIKRSEQRKQMSNIFLENQEYQCLMFTEPRQLQSS